VRGSTSSMLSRNLAGVLPAESSGPGLCSARTSTPQLTGNLRRVLGGGIERASRTMSKMSSLFVRLEQAARPHHLAASNMPTENRSLSVIYLAARDAARETWSPYFCP